MRIYDFRITIYETLMISKPEISAYLPISYLLSFYLL